MDGLPRGPVLAAVCGWLEIRARGNIIEGL